MYKQQISNRIIENEYEIYKNKLLYNSLKNMKPVTKTNWFHNEYPMCRKKPFLAIKDRNRIKGFINIAQENLKFFSKLQKSKSTYNLEKYMNDFERNQKYSNNIRKCRNVSLLRLNSTKKPKYEFINNPFNDKNRLTNNNFYSKDIKNKTMNNFYYPKINDNLYKNQKNGNFIPYFTKIFTIGLLDECFVEIFSQKIK